MRLITLLLIPTLLLTACHSDDYANSTNTQRLITGQGSSLMGEKRLIDQGSEVSTNRDRLIDRTAPQTEGLINRDQYR